MVLALHQPAQHTHTQQYQIQQQQQMAQQMKQQQQQQQSVSACYSLFGDAYPLSLVNELPLILAAVHPKRAPTPLACLSADGSVLPPPGFASRGSSTPPLAPPSSDIDQRLSALSISLPARFAPDGMSESRSPLSAASTSSAGSSAPPSRKGSFSSASSVSSSGRASPALTIRMLDSSPLGSPSAGTPQPQALSIRSLGQPVPTHKRGARSFHGRRR